MITNMNSFFKFLSLLVFSIFLSCYLPLPIKAQKQNIKGKKQEAVGKKSCLNTDRAKLTIRCKDRYYLGETPSIVISINNTDNKIQTVKIAEFQKFDLEMTGIFTNDIKSQTKKITYDGSWDIPKKTETHKEGEIHVFEALKKREPKFVKLPPGNSTAFEVDLSEQFGSFLGAGKYTLTVISEEGQKITKEFEVYFDSGKSVSALTEMLKSTSDDVTERNWAISNLAQFSRTKLILLLEDLLKIGNEKQRNFAGEKLADLKSGRL